MATSAFGKAFREAYDAGKKEFTFNGKRYNTKMAEDMPKSSNKSTSVEEKDEVGNPLKRELPTAKYSPQKFNRNSMSFNSPADKGLEEFMPSKVSTKESLSAGEEALKKGGKVKSAASKRSDGIAQRGHTKGRYL